MTVRGIPALVERLSGGQPEIADAEGFDRELQGMARAAIAELAGARFHRAVESAVTLLAAPSDAFWRLATRQVVAKHRLAATTSPIDPATLAAMASDDLCLRVLRDSINTSLEVEVVLTALRRWCAWAIEHDLRSLESVRPLAAALAHQAVNNEHIWEESDEERETADRLLQQCRDRLDRSEDAAVELPLLVLCQYRPLAVVDRSPLLMPASRWPPDVRELLERTVAHPLLEHGLRSQFARPGPFGSPTSAAVARQYDGNPYPRWLRLGAPTRTIGQLLAAESGTSPGDEPARILVAGCGSGRHPLLIAANNPRAEVIALDLSAVALAHGARRAAELAIENVTFVQGDLMDSEVLAQRFDHVDCIGVLHHIPQRRTAWRRLRDSLSPGGTMRIGVYGAAARLHVKYARSVLEAGGPWDTPRDIRRARRQVLTDPVLSGALPALAQSPDFFTTSTFRDLLLHVYEHHYSLDELRDMTEALDLELVVATIPRAVRRRVERRAAAQWPVRTYQQWQAIEWAYAGTAEMFSCWLRCRGGDCRTGAGDNAASTS